jgi:hypothetical protein
VAKIEFTKPAEEYFPAFTETIEVRIWALGGKPDQTFYIGSGANFSANGTFWLEITYSVEGAQIFYTRTFMQFEGYLGDIADYEKELDKIAAEGKGVFRLGDDLPDTNVTLKVDSLR